MNGSLSVTRRLALRLVAHAGRVLPDHRSDWAHAMARELAHLPDDTAALRWAFGAVSASYVERIKAFHSGKAIDMTRSFLLSAALACAGLLVIEGSHVLSQYLLQDRTVQLLLESLPASFLTTDAGLFVPLGILLTIVISAPLAVIAFVLGRNLIRWAPTRARAVIKATIAMDAAFLAGAILYNVLLGPNLPFSASTTVLWLIRVLFVAVPLLIVLLVYRQRLDEATASMSIAG